MNEHEQPVGDDARPAEPMADIYRQVATALDQCDAFPYAEFATLICQVGELAFWLKCFVSGNLGKTF